MVAVVLVSSGPLVVDAAAAVEEPGDAGRGSSALEPALPDVGSNSSCSISLGSIPEQSAGVTPHTNSSKEDREAHNQGIIDTLWAWCSEDPTCRTAYYQAADAPNRTVFRHLLPPGVPEADLYDRARDLLCGASGDVIKANRELWLQFLIAHRRTQATLCDVNHELVFRTESLTSDCVCRADRICSDALYDLTPTWIVLGLILFATIGFVVATIYTNLALLRAVSRITGRNTGDLDVLLGVL